MNKKILLNVGVGTGALLIGAGAAGTGMYFVVKNAATKKAREFMEKLWIPKAQSFKVAKSGKINYLALGDSLTSGYSTYKKVDATSYTDFIADYLDKEGRLGSYHNFAISGAKTPGLKTQLESDGDVRSAVAAADVINISIGANDLIEVVKIFQKEIKNGKASYTAIGFKKFLEAMGNTDPIGTFKDKDSSKDIYDQRAKLAHVKKLKGVNQKKVTDKSPIEVLFQLVDNIYSKGDKESYANQMFGFDYKALKEKIAGIAKNLLAIERLIQVIQRENSDSDGNHHQAQVVFLGYEFPFSAFASKNDPTGFHPTIDGKTYDLPSPLNIWDAFQEQLVKNTEEFRGYNKSVNNYQFRFMDINSIKEFKWSDYAKWDENFAEKPLFTKYMPNSLDIHPSTDGHRLMADKFLEKYSKDWGIKYNNTKLHKLTADNNNNKIELFERQNGNAKVDLWSSDLLKSMLKASKIISKDTTLNTQGSRQFALMKEMSKELWKKSQLINPALKDDYLQGILLNQIMPSFTGGGAKDEIKNAKSWHDYMGYNKTQLANQKQRSMVNKVSHYGLDMVTFLFYGIKEKTIGQIDSYITNMLTNYKKTDKGSKSTFIDTWNKVKKQYIPMVGDVFNKLFGKKITNNTKLVDVFKAISKKLINDKKEFSITKFVGGVLDNKGVMNTLSKLAGMDIQSLYGVISKVIGSIDDPQKAATKIMNLHATQIIDELNKISKKMKPGAMKDAMKDIIEKFHLIDAFNPGGKMISFDLMVAGMNIIESKKPNWKDKIEVYKKVMNDFFKDKILKKLYPTVSLERIKMLPAYDKFDLFSEKNNKKTLSVAKQLFEAEIKKNIVTLLEMITKPMSFDEKSNNYYQEQYKKNTAAFEDGKSPLLFFADKMISQMLNIKTLLPDGLLLTSGILDAVYRMANE